MRKVVLRVSDYSLDGIISGDTTEEIEKLRREGTGKILAHGGVSFARSLVRLDLADEYRLNVFPYLAGFVGRDLRSRTCSGSPSIRASRFACWHVRPTRPKLRPRAPAQASPCPDGAGP
jgi:riboflavin biosynthesis pyrimidine reductase